MLGIALFQLTSLTFQDWPPRSVTIFKMRPDHCFVQLEHVYYIYIYYIRPSIEFFYADAVWCLKGRSSSIHTPKSFSHVVSSCLFCVVSHCVCVALGSFSLPSELCTSSHGNLAARCLLIHGAV